MDLNLILNYIGVFVSFFLAFLLFTKKSKTKSDVILGIWLVVIGFHLFLYSTILTKAIFQFPFLLLFFTVTQSITNRKPNLTNSAASTFSCHKTTKIPDTEHHTHSARRSLQKTRQPQDASRRQRSPPRGGRRGRNGDPRLHGGKPGFSRSGPANGGRGGSAPRLSRFRVGGAKLGVCKCCVPTLSSHVRYLGWENE